MLPARPPRRDISFRRDAPGHGIASRPGQFRDARPPPSQVPEHLRVVERVPHPPDEAERRKYAVSYNHHDGLWEKQLFPARVPAGRQDVRLLSEWITCQLAEATATLGGGGGTAGGGGGPGSAETSTDTNLAATVKRVVPLLNTSMNEIVRQVTLHCAERGVLLQRVWASFEGKKTDCGTRARRKGGGREGFDFTPGDERFDFPRPATRTPVAGASRSARQGFSASSGSGANTCEYGRAAASPVLGPRGCL